MILPKANQKDLRDLPDSVRNEMEFFFAERHRASPGTGSASGIRKASVVYDCEEARVRKIQL